ncbi:hypothetical protein HanLR1_Chr02g0070991 [Helianthus annuus]|nr:hypothetical protein HanLR1_Chr02g0070991 [Helianthus annuus]
MERALSGTKMGGCKLKANVAKFAVENRNVMSDDRSGLEKKKEKGNGNGNPSVHCNYQSSFRQDGGKSFRDLFPPAGANSFGESSLGGNVSLTVDVPADTRALKDLFGKALVGRCVDLSTLNRFNKILSESGELGVGLSYLGGLQLLLKFPNEERCSAFITNNDLWNKWFSMLDVWLGQSLPFERVAWIKMLGVPIHLAVDSVFDSIAGKFGKVLHGSNRSSDDGDLSVNCVGVLVGDGVRITDQIDLKWDNKSFRVWIEEELVDWVPDCLKEEGVPLSEFGDTVMHAPGVPPVVGV